MWSLMLEACGAMSILVFIVWWTMFSGRKPRPAPKPKSSSAAIVESPETGTKNLPPENQ